MKYISNDSSYTVITYKILVSYILVRSGLKIVLCNFNNVKLFTKDDLNYSFYSEIHIFGDIYDDDITILEFSLLPQPENGYIYIYTYSHVPSNITNLKKYNSNKTKYFFLSKEIEDIFEGKKSCTDFQIIDE